MTIYRWEFGFDFRATPDWTKISAPGDPTDGAPICLLQDGLVNMNDIAPAWPSRLEVGDEVGFRIYDLTAFQGGSSDTRTITETHFSIVDPQAGDIPGGSPADRHPFGGPYSRWRIESLGADNPHVWPGGDAPAWEYQVDTDEDGNYARRLTLVSGGFAALSVLLKVQEGNETKWFGLDPEVWITDI